jgi:hypothetical protein
MRLGLTADLSHLYFGLRIIFLVSSIIFSLLWLAYGFDSVIEEIFVPSEKGLGVHLSTFQTASLFIYISMINFHVNGLTSVRQLFGEIRHDIRGLFGFRVGSLRKEYSKRNSYVGSFRASVYSCSMALSLIFVFEFPYVFFLNYFHFGSWLWPVYMFEPVMGFSLSFYRNMILLIFPMFLAVWLLIYPMKWRVKYRLNFNLLFLLLIMVFSWQQWILYDSEVEIKTPDNMGLDLSTDWVFPEQKLFPQTVYVYFDSPSDEYYMRDNMVGWHQYDWPVHFLNVLTKYMVFLSVGYIFMVRIEK